MFGVRLNRLLVGLASADVSQASYASLRDYCLLCCKHFLTATDPSMMPWYRCVDKIGIGLPCGSTYFACEDELQNYRHAQPSEQQDERSVCSGYVGAERALMSKRNMRPQTSEDASRNAKVVQMPSQMNPLYLHETMR